MFPPFKGGRKFLPCIEVGGGTQKVSDPKFPHFVAPPLPVINYQSLTGTGESLVSHTDIQVHY